MKNGSGSPRSSLPLVFVLGAEDRGPPPLYVHTPKGCGPNPRAARKSAAAGVGALRRAHRQPRGLRFAPPAREESGKMPQKQVFLTKMDPPCNP